MLTVNHLAGFGVVPAEASIAFTAGAASAADASSYTFTAQAVGTANRPRHILVFAGEGNGTGTGITNVTVGGVSGVQLAAITAQGIAAYLIPYTNGNATADVIVTFGGAVTRCGIAVYAVYDLRDGSTYVDRQQKTAYDTGSTFNISLKAHAGGVVAGYAMTGGTGGPGSFTWTTLTEDLDATVEATTRHASASVASVTGGTVTGTCVSNMDIAFESLITLSLR